MAIVMALEFQARGHSLGYWVVGFAVAGLMWNQQKWKLFPNPNLKRKISITFG